jgi:hypothetical protein
VLSVDEAHHCSMRPIRRAVGEWQLFTQICRCIRIAEGPEAAAKLSSPVCTAAAHLVTCRSLQNPQSLTIVDDATLHPRRLTDPAECSAFVLMEVETLGVARSLGWKVHMRCADGYREGKRSMRRCVYRKQLGLDTLVCTRGPNFPLSRLESRLMCPSCGSRQIMVVFEPLTNRAIRSG